jgi:hypothetical protein
MWRLVKGEFAYRMWEVGPAFGLVAFVLMAVGVRSSFSVSLDVEAIMMSSMMFIIIPMLIQMLFMRGEEIEKRLMMAGALPVDWKTLSAYRLLCSAILQLILFAIVAFVSRIIAVNGELISLWSLITLNGMALFFTILGLCFYEVKAWSSWRNILGRVVFAIINTAFLFGCFWPTGFTRKFTWPLIGTFCGILGAYLLAAAAAATEHRMFLKRSTLVLKE